MIRKVQQQTFTSSNAEELKLRRRSYQSESNLNSVTFSTMDNKKLRSNRRRRNNVMGSESEMFSQAPVNNAVRIDTGESPPKIPSSGGRDYYEDCFVEGYENSSSTPSLDRVNSHIAEKLVIFINEIYAMFAVAKEDNGEWAEICSVPHGGLARNAVYKVEKEYRQEGFVLNANTYVDYLITSIDKLVTNETIFPQDKSVPIDDVVFKHNVKIIFRRILRIYAIILNNRCLSDRAKMSDVLQNLKGFLYFAWFYDLLKMIPDRSIEDVVSVIRRDFGKDRRRNLKGSGFKARKKWSQTAQKKLEL